MTIEQASRRAFLIGSLAAGGALVVGVRMPQAAGGAFAPNAFVRIGPDDIVTVIIKHLDIGQGVTTGLSTIVAEELDADWAKVRAQFAPSDASRYANLIFGPVQATGGSTSIANSWAQLRHAGAAARAMLTAAAAQAWGVPQSEITTRKSVLSHASGRTASYGAFAGAAALLPAPKNPALKDPKAFTLIGTAIPRLDSADKTSGRAIFGLDVRKPGMRTAVIARSPRFGGVLASFDAAAALRVPGVLEVVAVPSGVAVIAAHTWAAIKGREALRTSWDDRAAEMRSTPRIIEEYRALAAAPGASALKRGDADAALKGAAKVISAEFLFPYLAHAPMEPLNAVVALQPDGTCEMTTGSQSPTIDQGVLAGTLGLPPEDVTIQTVWAGGSFGRRATPNADYVAEAGAIVKATGGRTPVHLVYTREDDIRGGRYRPMFLHRIEAGLDAAGAVVAWRHVIVGQSLFATALERGVMRVDPSSVEGIADTPYAIPHIHVTSHNAVSPVPVLWWRSVGHSHTAHAVEVMMDDLAHAAGRDPVAFRLGMLRDHPRHAAVLRLAADKAGWGAPMPAGQGRGVAVHASFQSYVAMVVEVTVTGVEVKVDRIVAAVDCGRPINPDIIRAQIEGGAGFGLGAALRNAITLTDGLVDQANFDAYEPLRLTDMPKIEVHITPSTAAPTGIGEPGVPPVAPALSNAIFAATGKRLRALPLDLTQGA